MISAELLILMLRQVKDQVSLPRYIKFRCLHVHHNPARKRLERELFAPSLIQSCTEKDWLRGRTNSSIKFNSQLWFN